MAKSPRKPKPRSPAKACRPAVRRTPARRRKPSPDRHDVKRNKPMTDKDHDDKAKHEADKREADKREADKREAGKGAGHVDNINQDPNHPANKTLSPERPPTQRSAAEGFNIPPDQLMTAQESDRSSEVHGVGPVSPPEVSPGSVETIQDQGIGPRTPYPTGNPPPPSESITRGQGIKGVTDKPVTKPDETKDLGGAARKEPGK